MDGPKGGYEVGVVEAPVAGSTSELRPRHRAPPPDPFPPDDRGTPDDRATEDAHALALERSDIREHRLRRVLALCDVGGVLAAYAITLFLASLADRPQLAADELFVFAAGIPLWIVIAVLLGLYHLPERRLDHSLADEVGPVILTATVWSWVLVVGRAVAAPEAVQVAVSLGIWATSIVVALALRAVVRSLARRRSWYRQKVIVAAGTASDRVRIVRRLERHPEFGLDVCGELDLTIPMAEEELLGLARSARVQRVVVATHNGTLEARSELIRRLLDAGVHVDLVSSEAGVFSSRTELHYLEGLPVVTFPVMRRVGAWELVKRSFDILAASIGLLLISPLLLVAAVAIKLDSRGPVFYRQPRIGRGGKAFELLKFRTMVVGADQRKAELAALAIHGDNGNGSMFKIERDPRVTRTGAWLRRWSIDELPQLWQVVNGKMSLVGPRPLPLDEAALVNGHFEERMRVRPGITGPWQAMGRSDIPFEDMIKLDYTYVANWSFSEDLRLLARTVEAVIHARGAY